MIFLYFPLFFFFLLQTCIIFTRKKLKKYWLVVDIFHLKDRIQSGGFCVQACHVLNSLWNYQSQFLTSSIFQNLLKLSLFLFFLSFLPFFSLSLFLSFCSFFAWLSSIACGILVSWPGIKPASATVEARSLNHWTSWEVPLSFSLPSYLPLSFSFSLPPSLLSLPPVFLPFIQPVKFSHTETSTHQIVSLI